VDCLRGGDVRRNKKESGRGEKRGLVLGILLRKNPGGGGLKEKANGNVGGGTSDLTRGCQEVVLRKNRRGYEGKGAIP